MTSDFAVAVLGAPSDTRPARLIAELERRTQALGAAGETLLFPDVADILALTDAGRAACVVFCDGSSNDASEAMIAAAKQTGVPLFPVLDNLTRFRELAPTSLSTANGFELHTEEGAGELAGLVLEALGLQRSRRKLFISYARIDSAGVAQQLREAFTARWYTVFHDTVSIRPGAEFQEELMQELADSDVMLLLNSKNVADRPYVQEEIAFANRAGVNGVQVVWPDVAPRPDALFTRVDLGMGGKLRRGCRRVPLLTRAGITEIVQAIADARTHMQEKRERELFRMVETYAQAGRWETARHHLGRFVRLSAPWGSLDLPFILGSPTSYELQIPCAAAGQGGEANVVYDPLGLSKRVRDHLDFLAARLPVRFLSYREAPQWPVLQ